MPLSKIGGIISMLIKHIRYGKLLGRKLIFMAGDTLVMIKASKHGPAERAADGEAGNSPGKIHAHSRHHI